jgi:hypothetical protein
VGAHDDDASSASRGSELGKGGWWHRRDVNADPQRLQGIQDDEQAEILERVEMPHLPSPEELGPMNLECGGLSESSSGGKAVANWHKLHQS